MILRFVNTNNEARTRVIAQVSSEKEAHQEIANFLKEHNYTSYYTRIWYPKENIKRHDVGSWSEFFDLELEDGEQFENNNKEGENQL